MNNIRNGVVSTRKTLHKEHKVMKLKAVISDRCPNSFRCAIEVMRGLVMERVIGPYLKRPDFGPAEFYIQKCDVAISEELLCEVRLSGVSLERDRSEQDFHDARDELERIYIDIAEAHLPEGCKIQLMVSLMLDAPMPNGSTLLEGVARWIESKQVA